MLLSPSPATLTWIVAGTATAGVITRPFRLPEALWAVIGALVLWLSGLLTDGEVLGAVARGNDVYLFLTGMMLLAELARKTLLFDHVAAHAVRLARGSARRLFALVYGVGTVVTVFMSNDATAVVLTPAVFAAARAARVRHPLPYLYICAFIANAASFVLPISNPANLVIFGDRMPPLAIWLERFALPSAAAIAVTFIALYWTQRDAMDDAIAVSVPVPPLSREARLAALGTALTAVLLLVASLLGSDLGWPTCMGGALTLLAVTASDRRLAWPALREISWGVLPLVAGLFVLVEGLARTGVIDGMARLVHAAAMHAPAGTAWGAGLVTAMASNLVNNLPAGLFTASALSAAHAPEPVLSAGLVGIDLGPNLSVTGSLATILWLVALRREGLHVGAWAFLRVGLLVMPLSLAAALALLFF